MPSLKEVFAHAVMLSLLHKPKENKIELRQLNQPLWKGESSMGSAAHGRGTAPLLQQRVQGALDGEVLVLHGIGGVNHSTGLLII